jgi:hypothetical protein
MSCGAELEANSLMTALLGNENFDLPDIDMSGTDWDLPGGINNPALGELPRLTNDDLTTKQVDGDGTFDYLMSSVKAHLMVEFKNNRITGAEYVKAYIALTEAAMQNATQYLIQRDGAFWQAATAQMNLLTARAQLAIAKAQFVNQKFDALTAKANYALTKLKLSTESVTYCTAQYNLSTMLPQQYVLLTEQIAGAKEQTKLTTGQIKLTGEQMESQRSQTTDTRSDGLPVTGLTGKQKAMHEQQRLLLLEQTTNQVEQTKLTTGQIKLVAEQMESQRSQTTDTRTDGLPVTGLTGKQKALLLEQTNGQVENTKLTTGQIKLVAEQMESQRSQTTDVRSDGLPVTGLTGKQKALYEQQITSYKRDAEVKAAKLFTDAWITQKTIDEGLSPPNNFANPSLDSILQTLKNNNQLG